MSLGTINALSEECSGFYRILHPRPYLRLSLKSLSISDNECTAQGVPRTWETSLLTHRVLSTQFMTLSICLHPLNDWDTFPCRELWLCWQKTQHPPRGWPKAPLELLGIDETPQHLHPESLSKGTQQTRWVTHTTTHLTTLNILKSHQILITLFCEKIGTNVTPPPRFIKAFHSLGLLWLSIIFH